MEYIHEHLDKYSYSQVLTRQSESRTEDNHIVEDKE